MQGMTNLAEFCLGQAAAHTYAALSQQHGAPKDAAGKPCQLWIVGMGKLGARELNVSSDIDLIYVYDSVGIDPSHTQYFFTQQVQAMQKLLADVTEHGFVFRVDLLLRPYGRDGTPALSLPSLAQYFQRAGREWERFAWLKSRVIPWGASATSALATDALALRAVVRAFVFRRFLDHKVFTSLQELHQLVRQNVSPAHQHTDVKLGRGGIREIEFAAQVLQIVRGGRQPELLARPTLKALQRLQEASLMGEETVQSLSEAYDFLRRTEHRIQYLDDQQTHVLPKGDADRLWLAGQMGFSNWTQFEWMLGQHQATVAAIFEQWLNRGLNIGNARKPTISMAELQAKAKWTVNYVRKHPDVADELLRSDVLTKRFDAEDFKRRARAQYAALQSTGLCDEEAMLDLLRRAHHIEVFRILVRDVQGLLSVRDVADELSSLADSMIALALPWCWERLPKRHTNVDGQTVNLAEHFCVIAYGKLGGKELGYGSDLDVVFLYQDEHPDAAQIYIALVRKLMTCLTVKTSEGDLYEIDTALRPNGNSGLLVTSMAAYEKYQLQRGSNSAWTWELQAMTRARCVYGSPQLRSRFDAIRGQVLCTARDPAFLKAEILAMRQKLRQAYAAPQGQFDIKHGLGGMMDAEFAVQYLVLQHAQDHAALIQNIGNIELLKLAQSYGLLPSGVGTQASDAYQLLRDQQHAARLQEIKPLLQGDQLLPERAAITALWNTIFG